MLNGVDWVKQDSNRGGQIGTRTEQDQQCWNAPYSACWLGLISLQEPMWIGVSDIAGATFELTIVAAGTSVPMGFSVACAGTDTSPYGDLCWIGLPILLGPGSTNI